jgi:hypothetical protein
MTVDSTRQHLYTMHVEYYDGELLGYVVQQHPFHLGTNPKTAKVFVRERLGDPRVVSIALRKDGKLVQIYDFRDLQEPFGVERK